MATRAVLQTFERYQKERVSFVSTVAEMAKSPQVRSQKICDEVALLASYRLRACRRGRTGCAQNGGQR